MTREEKELLLKDLSARLPYGVKVNFRGKIEKLCEVHIYPQAKTCIGESGILYDIELVKPYLRPMSSMTEEEKKEISSGSKFVFEAALNGVTGYCPKTMAYSTFNVDYCLSHHFDYRGLIEKGLAIAVTEENNPYKTKDKDE